MPTTNNAHTDVVIPWSSAFEAANGSPYPTDASSIGCMRINILNVRHEIWGDGVSEGFKKLVRDYLGWAELRTK